MKSLSEWFTCWKFPPPEILVWQLFHQHLLVVLTLQYHFLLKAAVVSIFLLNRKYLFVLLILQFLYSSPCYKGILIKYHVYCYFSNNEIVMVIVGLLLLEIEYYILLSLCSHSCSPPTHNDIPLLLSLRLYLFVNDSCPHSLHSNMAMIEGTVASAVFLAWFLGLNRFIQISSPPPPTAWLFEVFVWLLLTKRGNLWCTPYVAFFVYKLQRSINVVPSSTDNPFSLDWL